MKTKIIIFTTMLFSSIIFADVSDLDADLKNVNPSNYLKIVRKLVENNYFFAAVPLLKEHLASGAKSERTFDELLEDVVSHVGVKQFEALPIDVLQNSNAPSIKYILARKLFREQKMQEALNVLNGSIPKKHSSKPFALMLEASIHALMGKNLDAEIAYKECISSSNSALSDASSANEKRQLSINRDYCIVGIPRVQFAGAKFDLAELSYLDLPKSSYIWPEILFEEAWNSFYMRDYNRALGKLVTYKAPVLNFIFNPEIDILRAMSFLELCLWEDAKKEVDTFYATYSEDGQLLDSLITQKGKDYKYFFLLAKSTLDGRERANALITKALKSITSDPTYSEMMRNYERGFIELDEIRKIRNASIKSFLLDNLKEALLLQRNQMGAYVRRRLVVYSDQLKKSFEGMSYIKLEILSNKKSSLYGKDLKSDRYRGDIRNLERNEKQYFWTFNGEFWADELGDYVFSLKSECK
jgi:hypothetical protein